MGINQLPKNGIREITDKGEKGISGKGSVAKASPQGKNAAEKPAVP